MKYDKIYTITAVFFLAVFTGFLCKVCFWPHPYDAQAVSVPQTVQARQPSSDDGRIAPINLAQSQDMADQRITEVDSMELLSAEDGIDESSVIEIGLADSQSSSDSTTSLSQSDWAAFSSAASSDAVSGSSGSSGTGGSGSFSSGSSGSSGGGGSTVDTTPPGSGSPSDSASSGLNSSVPSGAGGVESFGVISAGRPSFAVVLSDGRTKIYDTSSQNDSGPWSIDNSNLQATVRNVTGQKWELTIKAKESIKEVWFPWYTETIMPFQRASDCVVYYPYLLGIAMRGDFREKGEWWGMNYPGPAFAPLMVLAYDREATMVAAANWPPKKVKLYYAMLKMSLVYEEKIEPSQTTTFNLFYCKAKEDTTKGNYAWHSLVDVYKTWLNDKMKTEGLMPINYPVWMKEIDGYINVQLQNMYEYKTANLYNTWNRWSSFFPWMQIWGQMSDYSGGCCDVKMDMFPRYNPELIQFARGLSGGSGQSSHIGYYTRPRESDDDIVNNAAGLNHILNWLQKNESDYCANAFYIDTFAGVYLGEPLPVARLFKDVFPKDLMIERSMDIYPVAQLVSGCLGGIQYKTQNWAKSPEEIDAGSKTAAFPAFGRYLLDDRILFMGESNGDHAFWGAKQKYWTERQAFLLGAKYDAITIGENEGRSTEMNRAMKLSLSERKRVSWWQREPVYWDTKGVSDISVGIQVRRFKDKNEKDLFVIDNWNLLSGKQFKFNGRTVSVPVKQLSISEIN